MRHRYLLDHEKLIFHAEEISFKKRIKVILGYTISGAMLAMVFWGLFYTGVINSPEKFILNKVNGKLVAEVNSVNKEFDGISTQLSNVQKRDDNFYRVISEINPIPASVRQAGFGGTDKYHYLEGFENSKLLIQSARKGDILLKQLLIQTKSYDTVIYFAKVKQDSLLSVPGILPVAPSDYYRVSDPFGKRVHPITGKLHIHTGIDLAAKIGKSVHASGTGKVVDIRKSHKGYGNRIIINHGYGFKTLYAHLNEILVKVGDEIVRGQTIGTTGNTGSSTGPHLHYEVIYKNIKRNPKAYFINDLSNDEFKKMIELLSLGN